MELESIADENDLADGRHGESSHENPESTPQASVFGLKQFVDPQVGNREGHRREGFDHEGNGELQNVRRGSLSLPRHLDCNQEQGAKRDHQVVPQEIFLPPALARILAHNQVPKHLCQVEKHDVYIDVLHSQKLWIDDEVSVGHVHRGEDEADQAEILELLDREFLLESLDQRLVVEVLGDLDELEMAHIFFRERHFLSQYLFPLLAGLSGVVDVADLGEFLVQLDEVLSLEVVERSLAEREVENQGNQYQEVEDEQKVSVVEYHSANDQQEESSNSEVDERQRSGSSSDRLSHVLCDHHLTD